MPAKPAPMSPPPPRSRPVSTPAQLFGVAAGPTAWIAQLVAGYGLSSYACYPGDAPLQTPPAGGEHALLLAINLAGLALAAAGFAASWLGWRRAGEAETGRARFLAACGLLASAAFAIAILFDTPSALALGLCWSIPR